jgi:F-type H+-transporting ATPase subunit b
MSFPEAARAARCRRLRSFSRIPPLSAMLIPLLAAGAPSGNSIADLPKKLGVEGFYLGMQLISFAILASVLYFFVLKPLLGTMEQRAKKIEEGLSYAKEMEARRAASENEAAEKLRQASIEAGKLIAEARNLAKEIETRAGADAQKRTEELIAKATQAVELDRQRVMAEARGEITRLVVATTEKVLRSQLTDADRARYNTAAAQELAKV